MLRRDRASARFCSMPVRHLTSAAVRAGFQAVQEDDYLAKVRWTPASERLLARGGGGGGWRLPTIGELLRMVDSSESVNSRIDRAFRVGTHDLWSSSPTISDEQGAWEVDFSYGSVFGKPVRFTYSARCVRGGLLPPGRIESRL